MLVSDFQNSIQGRHLVRNTEIGLLLPDVSDTVQSHSARTCSWPGHDMARLCMRTLISQEKSQTTHLTNEPKPRVRKCSPRPSKTPFPHVQQSKGPPHQFPVHTSPFKARSCAFPPPLVQQCVVLFISSTWHMFIPNTHALSRFSPLSFLSLNSLLTNVCTTMHVIWMWAPRQFQGQMCSAWPLVQCVAPGAVAQAPPAETAASSIGQSGLCDTNSKQFEILSTSK